jgi:hypothetical protein
MKTLRDNQGLMAPLTIIAVVLVAIMLIVVVIIASYVLAASGYGHGDKETSIGYVSIEVDLRGANPLLDDTYYQIENEDGTPPIHASFTTSTVTYSFMEYLSTLGWFSDKDGLRMEVTLSSSSGMSPYLHTDVTEFTWTIGEGSLTVYRTYSVGEPFFVEESGLYHITVELYKYDDGRWLIEDTETSSITVNL